MDWVKRLGQWHISNPEKPGECKCGMPMMGSNYAYDIPEEERQKCPKCHGLGEGRI